MTSPSVTVIIPVRDGEDLLQDCLASVAPQVRALGARLLVVDDCSSDRTSTRAREAGVEVVSVRERGGPYRARNVGWRATDADIVVFTDMRCRAREGWLAALVAAVQQRGVAIAGGVSFVGPGRSWAGRLMHQAQPMDTRRFAGDAFLPWAPGANLAVRREVLEALGGFNEGRSGGDIDLCWRAQLLAGGRFALADEAEMDWEPRQSMRACLAQWYRYGRWKPSLYQRFEPHGAALDRRRTQPLHASLREVKALAAHVLAKRARGLDVAVGFAGIRLAEVLGAWVGAHELRRTTGHEHALPAATAAPLE